MNNKIKPYYVDFNTAKWLKEKGFDEACTQFYREDEKLEFTEYYDLAAKNSVFDSKDSWFSGREEFNPIAVAPEQHVVIEWLRVNHGIWIGVFNDDINYFWMGIILSTKERLRDGNAREFNSPQEAYSAAFDYIKEEELI